MAEGLMEPSPPSSVPNGPADVASEMAAAVTSSDYLFSRRIEFHLERKPYSPISSASSQNFYLETLNPSCATPQRPTAMAAARSVPSSGQSVKMSDCGLDPELSFRITFRRIGAGLQNLGNTCFLNSVLQCLTYTEPFAAYLQSGKHKSSCRTAGFCAMCALQNHVMNALQSSGKILSPLHLVKNLRCISRNFRNSRQEDAHEYMVNLLESMHKCCLPSGVPTESPSAYEKSLVHKIFGGRLRSQVKCTQCQYCSNKFEPFLDLSLEIMKADSLRKALLHFTDIEQLDGGEKQYQCQRCKEKVRAYKQLTVHKAPHVLTIHLKRFGPHTGEKIDKRVEFQPTLDLKPFVSDPHEADLTYTLYGVLVHAGWSTRSGHYYCFVRTSSGMWHSLDDNQVLQVSEKTVLAQKAYMLFYVRDRSSAIKRAADVAQNFCAAASGNKIRSSSVLNGTIQNIERKSTFLGCSLAKTKADNPSNGHHVTVVDKSSGVALSNGGLSLQKNSNIIPKESQLQTNGHSISNFASCLQRNEVPSNGLQQTALLNVSKKVEDSSIKLPLASSSSYNQKLMETVDHLSHLKGDIIVPTSHVDSTSFTQKSGQKFEEKSRPYGSCNGKVNTIVLAQQNPDNSDSLKPSFEKCSKSLLKERSIHENGNAIGKVNEIPSTNSGSSSVNRKLITNSSQLNHINGSVAEQHFNPDLAEHQNTGSEKNKHSSGLQYQKGRENRTNLDEFGLDTLVKVPSAEQGAVAAKVRYNSVGKCSRSELKKEKHPRSLTKGHYFGRNQLFLKSLHLHKKKKHKRSKKRSLDHKKIMKDKIQEDISSDDQGASTSTSGRSDVVFMSSSKKRSRSSLEKEYKMKNDVKHSNCDFEHNQILSRDSKNDVVVDILEQPRMPINSTGNPCNGMEADASSKTPSQNSVMSLLMGLKKTTVPRWDDVETPSSQSHDLVKVHDSSSIGYVLDEWDEEYDRGKRKKVKKCRRSFEGLNPFQETANLRIQQKMKMKVDHVGSGNQPFRI